jgi:hypothetical protein
LVELNDGLPPGNETRGAETAMAVYHPLGIPNSDFNAADARRIMLDVISELSHGNDPNLQTVPVLREVARRLNCREGLEVEQAILTLWNDLFRSGQLSHGYNLSNPGFPFCHLTELGRETLKHASRDPANPDGYLEHLRSQGSLDAVAQSYIDEALRTYNANCFKAAAVMIGAATERIVLQFRDELVAGLARAGKVATSKLKDWRYKRARDAITSELESQKGSMPNDLMESFFAYWMPLTEQPRTTRNEAGHPVSIDPVTQEAVHASLLIFPELVRLSDKLAAWVRGHYT